MAYTDPAGFANEYQALHQQTSHPGFGDYHEPPPKRKRIRRLIRRILGRGEKQDQ